MSSSETGCGDGEELGLEAAAEAGGLTNFSKEERERRARRKHTNQSGHPCLMLASLEEPSDLSNVACHTKTAITTGGPQRWSGV